MENQNEGLNSATLAIEIIVDPKESETTLIVRNPNGQPARLFHDVESLSSFISEMVEFGKTPINAPTVQAKDS